MKIPVRSRRPVVNAVGALGRARSRRNQGKVDEARRNLKRRLGDELNSHQTCTRIILVLVHIYLKDTLRKYAVQYCKCGAI